MCECLLLEPSEVQCFFSSTLAAPRPALLRGRGQHCGLETMRRMLPAAAPRRRPKWMVLPRRGGEAWLRAAPRMASRCQAARRRCTTDDGAVTRVAGVASPQHGVWQRERASRVGRASQACAAAAVWRCAAASGRRTPRSPDRRAPPQLLLPRVDAVAESAGGVRAAAAIRSRAASAATRRAPRASRAARWQG